jgi:hypothetical protein
MNRKTFFLPLSTLSAIAIAIALAAAIAAGPAQPAYVPRAGNLDAVGDGNPIPTSRYQAALAAQAALTPAADKLPYYTGASTAGLADLTAFGRTLIDDANASTARSTLGLSAVAASGSASDLSAGTLAVGRGGTGLATYTVGDLIHASGTTTLANLADVSSGSVLVSGGVGAVPAWSASPTLTGGLTAGVTGQATPTRFNGLVGAVGGAGNGIVGVGHAPVSGYAMWVDAGTGNINGSAGNEIIAGQFSATNSPTSATSNATASFGVVTQGVWGGSANSSSDGLAYGGQLTGQVTGTASLKTVYGVEANALDLATGGTVVNANALWAHVTNAGSGNAITTARAVYAQIGGAGITDAIGVHIDLGSATSPTNVYGLKIDNVSNGATLNYAIYTGVAGLVHFGGAVDAPSVSTPTLYSTAGSISVGDGTSAIASLQVLGKTAQVEDLINLKIGGVSKFSVNNVGSVLFTGDGRYTTEAKCTESPGCMFLGSLNLTAYNDVDDDGARTPAARQQAIDSAEATVDLRTGRPLHVHLRTPTAHRRAVSRSGPVPRLRRDGQQAAPGQAGDDADDERALMYRFRKEAFDEMKPFKAGEYVLARCPPANPGTGESAASPEAPSVAAADGSAVTAATCGRPHVSRCGGVPFVC